MLVCCRAPPPTENRRCSVGAATGAIFAPADLGCYQAVGDPEPQAVQPRHAIRQSAKAGNKSRHAWEENVFRPARLAALAAAGIALTFAGPSTTAQDLKLPSTLTFTAYDTGSSGFNIAVAVGKMFKDKHNTDVRVLPAGNDVARLAPLRAGRAQASAMGIGTYFAQEGVFEFAVKEWGPQPLRLMLSSTDCNAVSLGVTKDVGVKEVKDL